MCVQLKKSLKNSFFENFLEKKGWQENILPPKYSTLDFEVYPLARFPVRQPLDEHSQTIFYSSWHCPAIQLACGIPGGQTAKEILDFQNGSL